MKNISELPVQKEIEARINSLTEKSDRQWGKMNVNEMVCHCSDQIKMAVGLIPTRYRGNFLLKTLVKHLILLGMPAPKGKVETVPELKQGLMGTKPSSLDNDKLELIGLLYNFQKLYEENIIIIHPAFGKMNRNQWARLCYIHLDYHLKQFSC